MQMISGDEFIFASSTENVRAHGDTLANFVRLSNDLKRFGKRALGIASSHSFLFFASLLRLPGSRQRGEPCQPLEERAPQPAGRQ